MAAIFHLMFSFNLSNVWNLLTVDYKKPYKKKLDGVKSEERAGQGISLLRELILFGRGVPRGVLRGCSPLHWVDYSTHNLVIIKPDFQHISHSTVKRVNSTSVLCTYLSA